MSIADPGHRHDGDDRHDGLHELMTVPEVAAALRVSRATVYRLVRSGVLPGGRVGKSVRIARRIVETLLREAGTGGLADTKPPHPGDPEPMRPEQLGPAPHVVNAP